MLLKWHGEEVGICNYRIIKAPRVDVDHYFFRYSATLYAAHS